MAYRAWWGDRVACDHLERCNIDTIPMARVIRRKQNREYDRWSLIQLQWTEYRGVNGIHQLACCAQEIHVEEGIECAICWCGWQVVSYLTQHKYCRRTIDLRADVRTWTWTHKFAWPFSSVQLRSRVRFPTFFFLVPDQAPLHYIYGGKHRIMRDILARKKNCSRERKNKIQPSSVISSKATFWKI